MRGNAIASRTRGARGVHERRRRRQTGGVDMRRGDATTIRTRGTRGVT